MDGKASGTRADVRDQLMVRGRHAGRDCAGGGRERALGPALGFNLGVGRRRGTDAQAPDGTAAEADAKASRARARVDRPQSHRVRFRDRAMDRAARGGVDRTHVRRRDEPAIPQRLAASPREHHAAGARAPGVRTGPGADRRLDRARLAARQKKARDAHATLVFTDESGFLLLPLVKTTLAPRGHTPVLHHRAAHRDKVSAAAALTLSPARGHVALYYQTYPDLYVDAEVYSHFLRTLLRQVRSPLVLLHDRGNMHRGPSVRAVQQDHASRLWVEPFPPYAPELNPTEGVWNYAKDKELANFVPRAVPELESAVCHCLEEVRQDQDRLRSFLLGTPLSWSATGLF